MSFPRFKTREISTPLATTAATAALPGANAEQKANVATVAIVAGASPENAFFATPDACAEIDLFAFHERAAIREHDGGMPRLDAENEVAREMGQETANALYCAAISSWRAEIETAPETEFNGFGKLRPVSLRFLDSGWSMKALTSGWCEVSLFGVHEGGAPRERIDGWGLVPMLAWGVHRCSIRAIERDFCILRSTGGAELMQSRMRANFDQAVVWWAHPAIQGDQNART